MLYANSPVVCELGIKIRFFSTEQLVDVMKRWHKFLESQCAAIHVAVIVHTIPGALHRHISYWDATHNSTV